MPLNVEIKARHDDLDAVRKVLRDSHAEYRGLDHQVDIYFAVSDGRLKLRRSVFPEENHIIAYHRDNDAGPKQSQILLVPYDPASPMEAILRQYLPVLVEVERRREIYYRGNVKFHIDTVADLGEFVEIEAIDSDGTLGLSVLRSQCNFFTALLSLRKEQYVAQSYSDLLLARQNN